MELRLVHRSCAVDSAFGPQAIERGIATAEELQEISRAWIEWAEASDGWLLMPHAELIAVKPTA